MNFNDLALIKAENWCRNFPKSRSQHQDQRSRMLKDVMFHNLCSCELLCPISKGWHYNAY